MAALNDRDLGRPIRVVVFGGAYFEPAALEFLAALDEHPEIELVGGVSQSRGFAFHHRIRDVVRRRGLMAAPVIAIDAAAAARRFARAPLATARLRGRVRLVLRRIVTVSDIHSKAALAHVRSLAPDLGLIYGAPILRPELFEIPALGTLGIHHGRLPEYRGKKTAFWAMYNGEPTADVTIQRVNAGLDTGEIVCTGSVTIDGKRFGRVDREVQELGVRLFVDAIVSVKRGTALVSPQPGGHSPLYRQPRARDILTLWRRQIAWRGR